jgi:hypothetical protein
MSSMTCGLPYQESSRFRTVRLSQIRLGLSDPDRRNDVQPQQSNIISRLDIYLAQTGPTAQQAPSETLALVYVALH